MSAIVECVPNISEGRDRAKIQRIADTVKTVSGVKLLDVDPNGDYNRTVITFAGDPDACIEATFQLTKAAYEEIDMRTHHGGHPRIGAVDVAPFVPVRDISMAECAELARRYGRRVGTELGLPVYFYEYAATRPERTNLAHIRKGEYEGLEEKLKDTEWVPDAGPRSFVPRFGCVVTGARFFLVAYNVNLKTSELELANEIALHVREMGWPMKDRRGNEIMSAKGKKVYHPGALRSVKGMGVYLEEGNFCQISMNLTNYMITAPHIAFEQVSLEAKSRGVEVIGSEIVGLIPLQALALGAAYYAWREKRPHLTIGDDGVSLVHDRLGLSSFRPFDPPSKIVEYALNN